MEKYWIKRLYSTNKFSLFGFICLAAVGLCMSYAYSANKSISFAAITHGFYKQNVNNPKLKKLVVAAKARTKHKVRYDGSYRKIKYPNGDVPDNIGVCTDVIIRSYRKIGIDLQKLLHKDIKAHFSSYPSNRIWGLTKPDKNIDHRRVPNLQVFFKRHGESLPVTNKPNDYRPGDLVTWYLPGKIPHIGIVIDQVSEDGSRPLIVHNIGAGPKVEDILFEYEITGHYRYTG